MSRSRVRTELSAAQSSTYVLALARHARYHADPSGTSIQYKAKAIGSGQEGAQGELQDKYKDVS